MPKAGAHVCNHVWWECHLTSSRQILSQETNLLICKVEDQIKRRKRNHSTVRSPRTWNNQTPIVSQSFARMGLAPRLGNCLQCATGSSEPFLPSIFCIASMDASIHHCAICLDTLPRMVLNIAIIVAPVHETTAVSLRYHPCGCKIPHVENNNPLG